ncbi:unnamed protein product [Symbiodinium sp. CCMP2592]|nr:unnamed protein product [Symbiodinium sp. CCMP2592]
MDSFLCLLLTTCTAEASFFDIFPVVDPAQHAVYDAESVQIVGTARVEGLQDSLSSRRWRPVQLSEDGKEPRALMSVGIGDFRNTSSGPYRELAIAFPACENEDVVLDCGSFMHCQDKLPACAHTFMLRSYASNEAAVLSARSAGISAQLSTRFEFSLEKAGRGHILAFSVMGSEDDELLLGKVEVIRAAEASRVLHFLFTLAIVASAERTHGSASLAVWRRQNSVAPPPAACCWSPGVRLAFARSCAASLLERAAATALSTNDAACLRLEEMETSMGDEDLQKALSCLSQAEGAVRDLLVSADVTGRLGVGLQRSAAVARRLEEEKRMLQAEAKDVRWKFSAAFAGRLAVKAKATRQDFSQRVPDAELQPILSSWSGAASYRISESDWLGVFEAMHLPSLQVVRLPSWGGTAVAPPVKCALFALAESAFAPRQQGDPILTAGASAGRHSLAAQQHPVMEGCPDAPTQLPFRDKAPARGQSDFMDMVREFNEGVADEPVYSCSVCRKAVVQSARCDESQTSSGKGHGVPKTQPVPRTSRVGAESAPNRHCAITSHVQAVWDALESPRSETPDLLQQHLHKEMNAAWHSSKYWVVWTTTNMG